MENDWHLVTVSTALTRTISGPAFSAYVRELWQITGGEKAIVMDLDGGIDERLHSVVGKAVDTLDIVSWISSSVCFSWCDVFFFKDTEDSTPNLDELVAESWPDTKAIVGYSCGSIRCIDEGFHIDAFVRTKDECELLRKIWSEKETEVCSGKLSEFTYPY